jgi:hypothetical protein
MKYFAECLVKGSDIWVTLGRLFYLVKYIGFPLFLIMNMILIMMTMMMTVQPSPMLI